MTIEESWQGPLGLRVDPRNPELLERLQRLDAYDFGPITKDVQEKYGWTAEKAAAVEYDTRQFLSLTYLDQGWYHIPEIDIDEYWHRMILHTQWYSNFCEAIYGGYYHHTPDPDCGPENEKAKIRTAALARYWFDREWGELVRTCTQCSGPVIPSMLRPNPETLPRLDA